MAVDQIIIEFTADTNGLKPALDILEELGQVEGSYSQKLKQTNTNLAARKRGFESNNQAQKQMLATAEKLAPTLNKVADAIEEGAKMGYAKAMAESGVKVKELEAELKRLNSQQNGVNTSSKSLRGELRSMQQQLTQLALAGKQNTQEYINLRNRAGELADAIGDASDEIRQAGSDTRGIDQAIRVTTALTGAFTIAQGTAALFGEENEEVQKAILKVTAAMSILNGLQAISAELARKDSVFTAANTAAKTAFAAATNLASTAVGKLKLALAGLGIGLVIAAIATLIENWDKWTSSINSAQKGIDEQNAALEKFRVNTEKVNKDLDLQIRLLQAQGAAEDVIIKKTIENAKTREAALKQELSDIERLFELRDRQARNEFFLLNGEEKRQQKRDQIYKEYVAAVGEVSLKLRENQIEITAAETALSKLGETKKKATKEAKELATGLDLLRQQLSEIDKKITALDPNKDGALITALFGDRKRVQDQITDAEKLLAVYKRIAEFGRTEAVTTLTPIETGGVKNQREIEERSRIEEERLKLAQRTNSEIVQDELTKALDAKALKIQAAIDEAEAKKRLAQETEDFIKNLSIDTAQQIFATIALARQENRKRELEAQLVSVAEARDRELAQENLTAEQRLQIQKKYAREEAIIRRKQFIADQNARISQVILDGISGVGRALVQFGAGTPAFFKALAVIAATTALSIGQIKAQKPPEIPAFKKGTRFGPGKVSLVGEEGPELKMVERGAKVYTADQTERIMQTLGAFPGLADQALKGMLPKPVSAERMQAIDGGAQSVNYDLMGKSIAKNLSFDKTFVSINADEKGFSAYLEKGNYKAKIRNKRTVL